jgi:hypothetical protein
MKTFLLFGLIAFAIAVIWKHLHTSVDLSAELQIVPSGVPHYVDTPAAQNIAQIRAAWVTNPDAVSEPGFAGAFGTAENQPSDGELAY